MPGQARLLVQVVDDRQAVDVGFHHPALRALPRRTRPMLAFLTLGWLLGEDGVERWVGEVEVHPREPKGTVPAEALPEIVQALAERHPEPTWALLHGLDEIGRTLRHEEANGVGLLRQQVTRDIVIGKEGTATVVSIRAGPIRGLRGLPSRLEIVLGAEASIRPSHREARERRFLTWESIGRTPACATDPRIDFAGPPQSAFDAPAPSPGSDR